MRGVPQDDEAARGPHDPRPVARARVPVRLDDPRRARRARDQGRAARQRRRDARLRAAARAKDSAYYFACNRSKESITVNLRSPDGQEDRSASSRRAPTWWSRTFPVGTLARYGLDFASLRRAQREADLRLLHRLRPDGPVRAEKGYDTVFQAMGGLMSLTGEKGGGPVKPGLPVADLTSGLWVAIAILAALAGAPHRQGLPHRLLDARRPGRAAHARRRAIFRLGEVPPRLGTEHPGRVPSATFRCKDGKYAHITAQRPALEAAVQGARDRRVGRAVLARIRSVLNGAKKSWRS